MTQEREKPGLIKRLQLQLVSFLTKRDILDEVTIRNYVVSYGAIVFCALAHVCSLLVFLSLMDSFMILLNAFCLLIHAVTLLQQRKGKYQAVGLILSLDVTIYALIYSLYVGIDCYILGYYALVCIMQFNFPLWECPCAAQHAACCAGL